MKHTVLLTAPRMLRDLPSLRPRLEATGWNLKIAEVVQRLDAHELLPLVGEIDGVICGGDRFTAQVFDAAPRLRAICKWGTGLDAIELEAARERGIAVRNVPDAFTVPVADTVFAFMLAFARRLPWLDRAMKAGRWQPIDGVSLAECTLGVIGVGNIGTAVLCRARAFGMRTLGCDVREVPLQVIDETGVQIADLDELLRESDYISLHCDLNPGSHRLIGARELALMKPSAVLINTARGAVVDEPTLIAALHSGRIAGAALDVFEVEPLPAESPLRKMGNVILTPHLANSSDRACRRVHERVIQDMTELLARKPPSRPVPDPIETGPVASAT